MYYIEISTIPNQSSCIPLALVYMSIYCVITDVGLSIRKPSMKILMLHV